MASESNTNPHNPIVGLPMFFVTLVRHSLLYGTYSITENEKHGLELQLEY